MPGKATELTTSQLKLGLNEYVPDDIYHADREYISSSGLKMLLKDPKEFYKVYVLNEKVEFGNQAALDFGSYMHCLILEPEKVKDRFVIFDGASRRGKAYDELLAGLNGRIVITRDQVEMANQLLENYRKARAIIGIHGFEEEVPLSGFFRKGNAEETACAVINGVKVKVRFDYRRQNDTFASIQDIKTTSDSIGTVHAVTGICSRLGYDISAALYADVVEQVTGIRHDFYWLFMSKKTADVKLFRASDACLAGGRRKYLQAIELLKRARDTGTYYENKIEEIGELV